MRLRTFARAVTIILLTLLLPGKVLMQGRLELNVNRFGGDYGGGFDVAEASACQTACDADAKCRAWTFVKPGRCYLKETIPRPTRDDCCISGISSTKAGGTVEGMEISYDRFGSDYEGFDLPTPRPELCQSACAADPRCNSWTYVRPRQGKQAACALKSLEPVPIPNDCCVSGVLLQAKDRRATTEDLQVVGVQFQPTSNSYRPRVTVTIRNNASYPAVSFSVNCRWLCPPSGARGSAFVTGSLQGNKELPYDAAVSGFCEIVPAFLSVQCTLTYMGEQKSVWSGDVPMYAK